MPMSLNTRSKVKQPKQKMQENSTPSGLSEAWLESTLQKFFAEAEAQSKKRFERLENTLGDIQQTLKEHTEEINAQRTIVASVQARVKANEDRLLTLTSTVDHKLADLEDRSRRDNIRILNIKEGEEKGNALAYLSENLGKWFPALAANPPELMRAHRIGAPRDSFSRPLIVKCLRFTDRDRILSEARKSPIQLHGKSVRFVPDYSDSTAKRRRPCYPVMHRARSVGFQAFLLYPATIKLIRGEEQHLFDNLQDADKFVARFEST